MGRSHQHAPAQADGRPAVGISGLVVVRGLLRRVPDLVRAGAGALGSLDRATEIELHPLSTGAVAQLVADVTGATPDSELLSWGVETGGYPGAVLELAEALCDEGAIEVAHGRSRLTGDLARSLEAIVARRLATLSAESRQLVEVAAVLGRSFRMADLASALGTPRGPPARPGTGGDRGRTARERRAGGPLVSAGTRPGCRLWGAGGPYSAGLAPPDWRAAA